MRRRRASHRRFGRFATKAPHLSLAARRLEVHHSGGARRPAGLDKRNAKRNGAD